MFWWFYSNITDDIYLPSMYINVLKYWYVKSYLYLLDVVVLVVVDAVGAKKKRYISWMHNSEQNLSWFCYILKDLITINQVISKNTEALVNFLLLFVCRIIFSKEIWVKWTKKCFIPFLIFQRHHKSAFCLKSVTVSSR